MVYASLSNCNVSDETVVDPIFSESSRRMWQATVQVYGHGYLASVRADYFQDSAKQDATMGVGDVEVAFLNSSGDKRSRLTAERITIDYLSDRIEVAGNILMRAAGDGLDTLSLHADTLVWDQGSNELRVPGIVKLSFPSGYTRGRNLHALVDLSRWSMSDVDARWLYRVEDGEEISIAISALGERGIKADSGMVWEFSHPRTRYDERWMESVSGTWEVKSGRLHLVEDVVVKDSSRNLRAGALDFDLNTRNGVAYNGVVVEQDCTLIAASELVDIIAGQRWEAKGAPLMFRDGNTNLLANRLIYKRDENVFLALERPSFIVGADTLVADSITFRRNDDTVIARNAVKFTSSELQAIAFADVAVFQLKAHNLLLKGNPVFRKFTPGLLEVGAMVLSIDSDKQKVRGEGVFRIDGSGVSIRSHRGVYNVNSDTVSFSGDVTIEIQGDVNAASVVTTDSVDVVLKDGVVDAVSVPVPLSGTIGINAAKSSWLSAGSGRLLLENGMFTRVELAGLANVTHGDPAMSDTIGINSRRMALEFNSKALLMRILAHGNALIHLQLPPRDDDGLYKDGDSQDVNEVKGEELEILLEDETVVEVRINGAVNGQYTLVEKDK